MARSPNLQTLGGALLYWLPEGRGVGEPDPSHLDCFLREHHQSKRRPTGLAAGARGDRSRDAATVGWSVGVSSRKKQLGLGGSATRYAEIRRSGTANG